MTRDEIAQTMHDTAGADWGTEAHFQRFAVRVAAAEREACAKVCDEIGGRDSDSHAWDAAAAIRARGGDVSDA
jgi:hypothetical protein